MFGGSVSLTLSKCGLNLVFAYSLDGPFFFMMQVMRRQLRVMPLRACDAFIFLALQSSTV